MMVHLNSTALCKSLVNNVNARGSKTDLDWPPYTILKIFFAKLALIYSNELRPIIFFFLLRGFSFTNIHES